MNRRVSFVLSGTDFGPMILSRLDFAPARDGLVFGVGAQLLETCNYEHAEVDLIIACLEKRTARLSRPVTFLDCGANIGAISIPVSKAISDFGNVLSFECQDWLFYALCGNVALNNCWNVHPMMVALGADMGILQVPKIEYRQPASFGSIEMLDRTGENIGTEPDYQRLHPVSMITIDYMRADPARPADFIKIDVEGMEMDVLAGAERTIVRDHPDMLIEFIKSDRAALEARLREWGYDISDFGGNLFCTFLAD